jgi:three-Cys-motif partner protein
MANFPQEFGSSHTEQKLVAVSAYLQAFVTALKNQDFSTVYFDVCAGSGTSIPKGQIVGQGRLFDESMIVEGSPLRALGVEPKFDQYIFNDVKLKNVRSLQQLGNENPEIANRITVTRKDASEAIDEFCRERNWRKTRAVVFIDPFGISPIKFSQLEALGRTGAVDMWYLIPVGAMNRQVTNSGRVLEQSEDLIDQMLGTRDWRHEVLEEQPLSDLFGSLDIQVQKIGGAEHFEKVAIRQLKLAFRGGVSTKAMPLGRNGMHEFSLVFACANPKPAANTLALRLANAVLK